MKAHTLIKDLFRKQVILLYSIIIFTAPYIFSQDNKSYVVLDKVETTTVLPLKQYQPFKYSQGFFSLDVDTLSTKYDLQIELTALPQTKKSIMPGNMVNITGENYSSYRLKPNGTHFQNSIKITIPYNPALLPIGYGAEDIHTYFYSEDKKQWIVLKRVEIDTIKHTITSLTDHFTDFANAVIKIPELPESKAFVSTTTVEVKDPNPNQGIPMIQIPEPNNFATVNIQYPLSMPPTRNSLHPDVSLLYNNEQINNITGVGWTLVTPMVTIDTKWGVPRYDPIYETEQYLIDGESVIIYSESNPALLLPHQSENYINRIASSVQFKYRDRKIQNYVIRHGNNPTNYWWSVTDLQGTTTYYGCRYNYKNPTTSTIDENSIIRTNNGCIAQWAITARIDKFGNYIEYYNENTENTIYLSRIEYTGNYNTGLQPIYKIKFSYKNRDDIITNGRLGVFQKINKLLCNIIVQYNHFNENNKDLNENLHGYLLCYEQPNVKTQFKSRLSSIVKLDSIYDVNTSNLCSLSPLINGNIERNQEITQIYLSKAEKEGDTATYQTISTMVNKPYGQNGIPCSVTRFKYFDAPTVDSMFSNTPISISGKQKDYLSINNSNSWSIGGTATVGFGADIVTTSVSAGGNYSYEYSKGNLKSMMMDIDGDGLPDVVYEDHNTVKYCKLIKNGNQYYFNSPQIVEGITKLSEEVTHTHHLGLQLSLYYINASYTRPISDTFVGTYFVDMNGDGLPDFANNGNIYINTLKNGIPTFVEADSLYVINNSSSCRRVIRTGNVDENLECKIIEYPVDTIPLTEFYPIANDPFLSDNGIIEDYMLPEVPISILMTDTIKEDIIGEVHVGKKIVSQNNKRNRITSTINTNSVDINRINANYIYKIEGDNIIGYNTEIVCEKEDNIPNIETVRVWVSPGNGIVSLNSKIHLIEDTTYTRQQSVSVDGVKYYIQHTKVDHTSGYRMYSAMNSIVYSENILSNDYTEHNRFLTLNVEQGDIIFFRLSSQNSHDYDNTEWTQTIQFTTDNALQTEYSSSRDFLCYGNQIFQADSTGNIKVSIKYTNNTTTDVYLKCFYNNVIDTTITISTNITDTIEYYRTINQPKDSISFKVNYTGTEPCWSELHITSTVYFDTEIKSEYGNIIRDTLVYHPDVRLPASKLDGLDSVYYQLFGPLHKGWGYMAYQNQNNDSIIILDSLFNSRLLSASLMPQEISSTNIDTTDIASIENQINDLFTNNNLFNPIGNNYWIPIIADNQTEQWIPYGNIGAIGKTNQSNAQKQVLTDESQTGSMYDSYFVKTLHDSQPAKIIRKHTKSKQHAISLGSSFLVSPKKETSIQCGISYSCGSYTLKSDVLDMNGDGFPDFVGIDGIQYTFPWGGIGRLQKVNQHSTFTSKLSSFGNSFSASPSMMKKEQGTEIKKTKYSLQGGAGISSGHGKTEGEITYIDINGDGLPDKINNSSNTVCFNLGYSFTAPVIYNGIKSTKSRSWNIDPSTEIDCQLQSITKISKRNSYSIKQMSISGGLDVSISSNSIKRDFIDINGDGYPDIVELKNDTVNIYLNKGYEIEEECSNLNSSITKISEDTSIYINTYLGITAGFTFCGTYKFNAGVHSTYSGSIESGTSSEFMDINGDGLPDYVISDNKNNRLLVYLNKTNKTNLLNKIINPTQEIIELDYTLSDVNQNKKERNWQLTQITEYQPSNYKNSQEKSFIEIEYSDPYYDNFERTYYGYSNVITEYNKEKFIIEKFENKNYLNAGEKTEDWLLDRQYKPIIRHKIGKEYKHATTGTIITNLCDDANIQEAQSGYWTYYYEGEDAPQIITYYSIEYDSIHNMIRYEDKGDTAVVGDEYVQIITYLPTTSKNQISLPKTEIIKDHTGKILRSSSINYDTNGSPKQIVFHNQTNNTNAITSFEYDNYGNIILLAKPENINGERAFTSYDYDPVCAMYPQKISDEFELNTEIYYDYRFGLPIKKIDVAGNTVLYKYDYMGRLTNVLMPNEITDNYPYTIKYDYYNVNHELKLQEDFLLENNIYQQQPSIGFATFKYTYVNKTQHDNLVSDTKYLTLYDAYGNVMQKKRQQQNGRKIEWICYENNILDNFMRPIIQSYPKKCTNNIYDYEQIGNHVISTNYDVLNRQTRITNPDSTKIEFDYGFKTDISGNIRLLTSLTKENDRTILQLRTPQGFEVEIKNGEDTITSLYYSAIGELLQTIDPEGYVTKYTYDNLGRIIERQQPDVGICQWTYDKAGNITEYKNNTLINKGLSIKYDYSANRLMKVIYPQNISNNIDYEYDSCGRIHKRRDHCGTETFTYDALGNISKSERKIVLPTEANSYTFTTEFIYDSFGKIQTIIYPDGEQVSYNYKSGGILHSIEGNKNNVLHTYLEGREYDEFGRVILENNGNGVLSTYKYSDTRCWIEEIQRSTTNGVFQKLFYNYDAIGNILKIEQSASMQNGMGGRYINNYQYNNLDMLINSQGQGIDNPIHTYEVVLEYDKCGSIGLKRFSSENYNCNLIYGYDNKKQSHQPRVISDEENSPLQLFWDYNGNLSQINNCQTGVLTSHLWDEENRMQLMIHDDRCGYYGYDGNGKRVYKITGNIFQDNINASSMDTHFVFDDAIMYPNPYMTVTSQGYTKHYYVGNDIIATSMGTGGFDEVSTLTIKPLQSDHEEIIVKQFQDLLQERYPFGYELEEKQETKELFTENVDINEKELLSLQYQCNPKQICQNTKTYVRTNMFLPIISVMRSNTGIENSVYYRYTDHLGTSNWITDTNGVAVQYLHYGPFGELLDEQSTTSYNERYRFTSKERDEESGYHYFGARYYTDHLGIWTSADPLLDKYPSISPYSYCSNNPLKFIDPDGRKFDENNKLIAFDFLNRIINKAKNTKNKLFLNELEQLCIDIDFMICDENTEYVFNKIDNNDKLQSVESSVKQCNNGLFLFTITYYDDEIGIHELKHAGDYARGFLILFPNEEKNYNINHEIRAYKAQLAFCGSLKLYTLNYLYNFPIIVTVNSLSEITEEFVRSLSNSSILNEPLYLYLP